jgi:hypothetical protein
MGKEFMIRKVIRRHCRECVGVPGFRYVLSVSVFLVAFLFPQEKFETLHQTCLELRTSADCSLTVLTSQHHTINELLKSYFNRQ